MGPQRAEGVEEVREIAREPGPETLSSTVEIVELTGEGERFDVTARRVQRWACSSTPACASCAVRAGSLGALDQAFRAPLRAGTGLLAAAESRGLSVVVSHDRTLLDELTTSTILVSAGTARLHPGNYSAAKALWEADADRAREDIEPPRGSIGLQHGIAAQIGAAAPMPPMRMQAAHNLRVIFICFSPVLGDQVAVRRSSLRQNPLDQVLDLGHVFGGTGLHDLVFFFVTIRELGFLT